MEENDGTVVGRACIRRAALSRNACSVCSRLGMTWMNFVAGEKLADGILGFGDLH
jgi:hypothetical protein